MSNNILQIYFSDIQSYPILTPVQEQNLGYLLLKGTERQKQNAKKKLVESNLRLVVRIVNQMKEKGFYSELDLIQQGNLGLIQAANKYDITLGFRFSTYASYWIRGYINEFIAKDMLIKHPADKLIQQPISLNSSYGEDENTTELIHQIRDPKDFSPTERIEQEELSQLCKKALAILPENERLALIFKCGFDNYGAKRSLSEVGKKMLPYVDKHLSKESVRQLCLRGAKKIIKNPELGPYLKEFY